MKAAWPSEAEVGAAMVAAGLVDTAPADLQDYIDAALEEFEDRTGFRPFLQGSSAAWRFDPPEFGQRLELRAGYTEITEVRTGLSATNATGTVLTVEEDYILLPYDARARNRPFTAIQFLASTGTGDKSIKVTGKKGFHNEIAEDAWLAVLGRAAVLAVEDLTSSGGEASRIKQGQVEIQYGEDGGSILSKWNDRFDCTVGRYQRVVV
jgi:hypothetical protein